MFELKDFTDTILKLRPQQYGIKKIKHFEMIKTHRIVNKTEKGVYAVLVTIATWQTPKT